MKKKEIQKLRKLVEQQLAAEARQKIMSELRELSGRIALGDVDGVLDILVELEEVFDS